MKTETTKRLEQLLANRFNKRNDFYVFECTIGWYGKEIVDCIMYNCQRETYCYEIKQSKQDFHSKNKLTFIGNKNYFVMPYKLYQEVKNEIPPEIGVLVAIDRLERKEKEEIDKWGIKKTSYWTEPVDGLKELYCIKTAAKQELKADKEVILSSMLRSMQRDRIYDLEMKEKIADEMFKKLGYKKREVYNGYLYTDDTGFNIKITNTRRIDLYYDSEEEKYENLIQLTFGELQAINKKVEELG